MSERRPGSGKLGARWKALLAAPNDSPGKIVGVAVVLCLVCSVVVSAAAIGLRPLQDANKALEIKKNILQVSGLMTPVENVG